MVKVDGQEHPPNAFFESVLGGDEAARYASDEQAEDAKGAIRRAILRQGQTERAFVTGTNQEGTAQFDEHGFAQTIEQQQRNHAQDAGLLEE